MGKKKTKMKDNRYTYTISSLSYIKTLETIEPSNNSEKAEKKKLPQKIGSSIHSGVNELILKGI